MINLIVKLFLIFIFATLTVAVIESGISSFIDILSSFKSLWKNVIKLKEKH